MQQVGDGNLNDPHRMIVMDETARSRVLEAGLARELAALNTSDGPSPTPGDSSARDPFGDPTDSSVLGKIARHYPAETARFLTHHLTPESTPPLMVALTSSATYWASEDPATAAVWAASLPPGDARASAAVNVFDQWKQFDPTSARAWWESWPAEERARTTEAGGP